MSCVCVFCGRECEKHMNYDADLILYDCPVCGRYEISIDYIQQNHDRNRIMHYLYYHHFVQHNMQEYKYNSCRSKEECDNYKKEFENGNNIIGIPVHMDYDMINAWYPKSFSERIDLILIKLNSLAKHIGQSVPLCDEALYSLMFVDVYEFNDSIMAPNGEWIKRKKGHLILESDYMIDYLNKIGYITRYKNDAAPNTLITILPKGYSRIDELQRNTSNGRNVLVAMKFGNDTINLREAIRKGISDADYNAVFIDEVQHNEFITPELLKHIRDSKFVVVDLTHKNNGAYFEEGYAMGLGKPVIQLCCKNTKLHFDVAQKNTIIWNVEDDIPLMLANRIRATIE